MKRLIFLFLASFIALSAFSQARLKYVTTVDSFNIIIDGTKYHKMTKGKYEVDTISGTVIYRNGTEIATGFTTSSHDHTGGAGATIDHVDLSNKGSNTHPQIDSHIGDASNPHGITLTQSNIDIGNSIYSVTGTITTTATTNIIDLYEEDNSMWLLTYTGEHTAYNSIYFGFNAYLVVYTWDGYGNQYNAFVAKLGEESYSGSVVCTTNGDIVRLQSNEATATHPLYWTILKLR